ncbi:MAG: putative DNA-binding domain-containing protein [Deltaproteobacteria bacterium]|nr:putative DNA-binding domain-containing protein [Deltaproteobacteria bacterium]
MVPMHDDLLDLQRRFLAGLQEPLAGPQRDMADLPPVGPAPAGAVVDRAIALLADLRHSPATRGWATYRGQYWYRLLDSLREDLPALRVLLGEATADTLFEAYLLANPPRSPTLRHLPVGLAEFIQDRPDLGGVSGLAADVARLEIALCLAYEAADAPLLPAAELLTAPVGLAKHLQLLRCANSILGPHRHFRQSRRWRQLQLRPPRPQVLAAYRDGQQLRVVVVTLRELAVLEALAQLGSVAAALQQCRDRGILGARDARAVQRWFARWQSRGWLVRRLGAELGREETRREHAANPGACLGVGDGQCTAHNAAT